MLDQSLIPSVFWPKAQQQWQAFVDAASARGLAALDSLVTPPEFVQHLSRIWAASEFVVNTAVSKPEYLVDLVESGFLYRDLGDADLQALQSRWMAASNEVEFDRLLRQDRNRYMMRFIWRDMNRLCSMQEMTLELSRFADLAIQTAADYYYRELAKMYGTPQGRESGQVQPFMILGMGKLGARELNLSSDIDLIFTFPEAGETNHPSRALSNQEFFVKLGQKVIKSLDTITADGFVFRVDMRLRPHGESGSMALNFNAMEDYYQTQGREWERYAMIKARRVAFAVGEGVNETYSEAVKKELRTMLQPFTYRQYIDYSAIESLREMKALIHRQVQRKGMSLDVKLGEGGIREIEFVVQVFQLIRGGRDARLRKRRVLKLLPLLESEGYLPKGVAEVLAQAYIFLRNTEHAIQGYQDRQTQALPTDELGQLRLAFAMGFSSWEEFNQILQQHRDAVHKEFMSVIADPDEKETIDNDELSAWVALWEASSPLQSAEAQANYLSSFTANNFQTQFFPQLRLLRDSRPVMSMQASSRGRMDEFIPRLLHMLVIEQENLPISAAETLARILPLIESIARRSAYLVLLIENPQALHQVVRLCAASPWIADQLTKHPALLDELLSPANLYAPPEKNLLRDELRRDVLRFGWDDLEGHMEALRYFRSAHALRVAASEVTGTLPLMKVSDYLTFIAEVVLEHSLALSWASLTARHGFPLNEAGEPQTSPQFIIVGYGKLGGIELGHGSDLDMVFIHNANPNLSTNGTSSIDNLTFYSRLGQKILHILSTQTLSGKLYETDMRLRPSGNSGPLVASLTAFERYQQKDAWTWEHQALVRARVVAGDESLAKAFDSVRLQILQQPRDLTQLRKDVREMRLKMRDQLGSKSSNKSENLPLFNLKQDAGGIVDIEFMVQYAALAWAHQSPAIVQYTDNIRILGSLEQAGLLDADSVAQLIAAYKAFRSTGHRLALQQQEAVLSGDEHFAEERDQVSRIWARLMDHPDTGDAE